jgi:acyl dehydratase
MVEQEIVFDLPVAEDKVTEFAVAVGAENVPSHHDTQAAQEQGLPNFIAPPTFTVTQIFVVPREERERRLGANLDYGRVLHGEQEFLYARMPIAGETLKARMRIAKDFEKEGKRGGSMRFVTYETVYTDAEDAEVLRANYTLLQTSKDPGS